MHCEIDRERDCPGTLRFLDSWADRFMQRGDPEWSEVLMAQYQCDDCAQFVTLKRPWKQLSREELLTPARSEWEIVKGRGCP